MYGGAACERLARRAVLRRVPHRNELARSWRGTRGDGVCAAVRGVRSGTAPESYRAAPSVGWVGGKRFVRDSVLHWRTGVPLR